MGRTYLLVSSKLQKVCVDKMKNHAKPIEDLYIKGLKNIFQDLLGRS